MATVVNRSKLPYKKALAMIDSGDIYDAKTIAGLLLAGQLLL
jgi:hypothetical protein